MDNDKCEVNIIGKSGNYEGLCFNVSVTGDIVKIEYDLSEIKNPGHWREVTKNATCIALQIKSLTSL